MTATMIADDLFAGAGGWDLAAEALGIHARGVENMPAARATRDAAGLTTIHDDVWTYAPDGTAELLIASPPCQTFSQAGKGSGRAALETVLKIIPLIPHVTLPQLRKAADMLGGEERTALVLTPLWFAVHGGYRALAWEQVPTVLPVWEACAELLRTLGWNVVTGKLNSEQYGVPQTRTRAVLLASLDRVVELPAPTHSRYHSRTPSKLDEGVEKWVSMAEALGWTAEATMVSNYGTGGDAQNRGERTGEQPAPTVTSKIDRNVVHGIESLNSGAWGDKKTTRDADQPALSVTGSGRNVGFKFVTDRSDEVTPEGLPRFAQQSDNEPDYAWPDNRPATVVAGRDLVQAPGATANRFNGSTKSRNDGVRVTVAEAGVLQSFPADFPWQGNKSKQYLQAGNAVPVLMGLHALASAAGLGLPGQPERAAGEVEGAADVVYVNGTHDHAARRPADAPAPTVMFGARSNLVTWQHNGIADVEYAGAGQTSIHTAGQRRRKPEEPAHTVTGKGTAAWCPPVDDEASA